jgi:alkylhydroperoxidase/carboxymuconolactone decarboxylase family protein YurZ
MHEHDPTQGVIQQETVSEDTIRKIARVVIPYAGTEQAHEEPQIIHQVSEFRANLPA